MGFDSINHLHCNAPLHSWKVNLFRGFFLMCSVHYNENCNTNRWKQGEAVAIQRKKPENGIGQHAEKANLHDLQPYIWLKRVKYTT